MAKDSKSILEKIRQIFADNMPIAYKLADGTDLTISLLDVGGDVAIGGQPATEGTYTLEDGTNITVDSTGKITSVSNPEDMAATEYTLADGTKITIDKMEVGGQVMQGDSKIPNGEYTLEDGSKISCVDGLITEIAPKEDMDADTPQDTPTNPSINEQVADLVSKAIQDELGKYKQGLESQYNQKFADQENKIKKQDETIKKVLGLMTELADAPSADPLPERKAVNVFSDKTNTKKSKLDGFIAAAAKLNEVTPKN